jgi:hypothetical protein
VLATPTDTTLEATIPPAEGAHVVVGAVAFLMKSLIVCRRPLRSDKASFDEPGLVTVSSTVFSTVSFPLVPLRVPFTVMLRSVLLGTVTL